MGEMKVIRAGWLFTISSAPIEDHVIATLAKALRDLNMSELEERYKAEYPYTELDAHPWLGRGHSYANHRIIDSAANFATWLEELGYIQKIPSYDWVVSEQM